MLDLYCERTGPGLWAEPVNALTNIGFVFVAWLIWRIAAREQVQDSSIAAITATIMAIGIGSFLFHTMPGAITRWLDVVPVFVFQLLYLGFYSRRVSDLSMPVSGILLLVFLTAVVVASRFEDVLNGSLIYAPALLVICILGACHYRSKKAGPGLLLGAAGMFLVSIVLRSVDLRVCIHVGLGTHFLWHILNAFVMYLAMRALVVNLSTCSNR
ncbi:MAG: ceramidase [Gammaproteobacteria bacterium]|jgi:hypothetical protein|nr:ceramidase [Gammaproteobacteria bacterium]